MNEHTVLSTLEVFDLVADSLKNAVTLLRVIACRGRGPSRRLRDIVRLAADENLLEITTADRFSREAQEVLRHVLVRGKSGLDDESRAERVFRNEDGTIGLFTTGLAPLGHMEIEIPRIDMDPGELREWLLNIICYLLEKGPVLKHGETLGMTGEQKIRIRHCKSSFGRPGQVLRLEP